MMSLAILAGRKESSFIALGIPGMKEDGAGGLYEFDLEKRSYTLLRQFNTPFRNAKMVCNGEEIFIFGGNRFGKQHKINLTTLETTPAPNYDELYTGDLVDFAANTPSVSIKSMNLDEEEIPAPVKLEFGQVSTFDFYYIFGKCGFPMVIEYDVEGDHARALELPFDFPHYKDGCLLRLSPTKAAMLGGWCL